MPEGNVATAVTGLVAIEGTKVFLTVLPPITEVRKRSSADVEFKNDMRAGEVLAGSVILLGSMSVSAISGSQAPAWLGLATLVVLVGVYEWTLARPGGMSIIDAAAHALDGGPIPEPTAS